MIKGLLFASLPLILAAATLSAWATPAKLGSISLKEAKDGAGHPRKLLLSQDACLSSVLLQSTRGSAPVYIIKAKVSYAHDGFGVIRAPLAFKGTIGAGGNSGWLPVPQKDGLCVTAIIVVGNVQSRFGKQDKARLEVYGK